MTASRRGLWAYTYGVAGQKNIDRQPCKSLNFLFGKFTQFYHSFKPARFPRLSPRAIMPSKLLFCIQTLPPNAFDDQRSFDKKMLAAVANIPLRVPQHC
jgi:hypothetical protein